MAESASSPRLQASTRHYAYCAQLWESESPMEPLESDLRLFCFRHGVLPSSASITIRVTNESKEKQLLSDYCGRSRERCVNSQPGSRPDAKGKVITCSHRVNNDIDRSGLLRFLSVRQHVAELRKMKLIVVCMRDFTIDYIHA